MSLFTKTVGRSHREYIFTRYRAGRYENSDVFRPVWEIDRQDHHLPAWRGALCFTQSTAEQDGGPTDRDALYGPFYLEAEGPTYEVARDAIVAAVGILMRDHGIPLTAMRFMYSGSRSPWVYVEPGAFAALPSPRLPEIYQSMAQDIADRLGARFRNREGKSYVDTSIYSWNQLRRATNSRHQNTGLYAIPLTWSELITMSGDQVRALAAGPRFMAWTFGAVQESPAAALWYRHHVGKTYSAKKAAEIEAERRRRRAPRYFVGLRKCVQALLHIPGRVPLMVRNHALYGISLAFRDAGYSIDEAADAVTAFYEGHCERHPGGEDDSPRDIRATVRSAYSERRRFSERRFIKLFGEFIQRSNLPEVVKIPRAEMDRLLKRRATSAEWRTFLGDWARRESPTDCRSYVMLDRSFVDITLPRLEDGSIKTFAYLLYASSFQRTKAGQGRWAYRVHDYVNKETVCRRTGLKPGTVGRHLAILRRLRVLVGQMLNPLPIPLTTVRVQAPVIQMIARPSTHRQTEEVNKGQSLAVQEVAASVTSFRGADVGVLCLPARKSIRIGCAVRGLGIRRRVAALGISRARRVGVVSMGVEVAPGADWAFMEDAS